MFLHRVGACALFSHYAPSFVAMRYACYTSMGHGNSFQREFFCYAGSATHPSSQFGLCLSASPSLWHYRANATYDADFAFPLDSSLCDAFLPHAYNQSFVQQIPIRRFTVLHSLCWLSPSTFIPPSFRLLLSGQLTQFRLWRD